MFLPSNPSLTDRAAATDAVHPTHSTATAGGAAALPCHHLATINQRGETRERERESSSWPPPGRHAARGRQASGPGPSRLPPSRRPTGRDQRERRSEQTRPINYSHYQPFVPPSLSPRALMIPRCYNSSRTRPDMRGPLEGGQTGGEEPIPMPPRLPCPALSH